MIRDLVRRGLGQPTTLATEDLPDYADEGALQTFLDEVAGLGPATLENLCAFIRADLEPRFPQLCAVSVERQASGDRCRLSW